MYKYFINCLVLLCCLQTIKAQKNKELKIDTKVVKDRTNSLYYPKDYGIRFGIDILKPILAYSWDNFKGFEAVADYRLTTRMFIATEFGYTDRTIDENNFNHTVAGSYLKTGINYNLYNNWLQMDNELYVGARYGFANFSNQLNRYTVFQNGEYFEQKQVNEPVKSSNLNTHWVELVAGIKVEVLNNLYMGIMISVNRLITTKDPNIFENTYSPGFGNISENGSGANINYTISYRIPFFKK